MNNIQMRSAFSMITAIFVMVLMASISLFVLNLSGKIVNSTVVQYQHEQAEIYAKNYTEYAILAVTGNDRNKTECVDTISGNIGINPDIGNGYKVTANIAYIVNGDIVKTSNCKTDNVLSTDVKEKDTPLSIIIDVYVKYKDPNNTNGPWLTVHRRTTQKI